MSRQFWSELLWWATADGTAVTANGTETIIFPDVTIPANYLSDGRAIEVIAQGKFSTTTGPPTLRIRARIGGVAGVLIADSGTITTVASVTNAIWEVRLMVQTRTNGASGTVFAMGNTVLYGAVAPTVGSATGAPGIAAMGVGGITAPAASAAIDLTADKAFSLTATWSSASNSLTGHNYFGKSLN
jgi:hypothetical protein